MRYRPENDFSHIIKAVTAVTPLQQQTVVHLGNIDGYHCLNLAMH